ncbi:hypothetical protein B4098_1804 [Heyndrickxia coagulans]|uniref:Uncharacterized protein n=1 Tax=Heyndrickxia coagulans TaxID=1398 RepID=A0A150KA61_HEYCO|nr:hypothetical protein B4098_1804 [Heyndrickxia coagulans]
MVFFSSANSVSTWKSGNRWYLQFEFYKQSGMQLAYCAF